MRSVVLTVVLLLAANSLFANLPDKIEIKEDFWSYTGLSTKYEFALIKQKDHYILYQTLVFVKQPESKTIKRRKKKLGKVAFEEVAALMEALNAEGYQQLDIKKWPLNPDSLAKQAKAHYALLEEKTERLGKLQKDFIRSRLADPSQYSEVFESTVMGGLYGQGMHYGSHFEMTLIEKGQPDMTVKARHGRFGMPWKIKDRDSYNPAIPRLMGALLEPGTSYYKSLFNLFGQIPAIMTDYIFDGSQVGLRQLEVEEFATEFDELKAEFDILKKEKLTSAGRYIGHSPGRKFRLSLYKPGMPKNMTIEFFISEKDGELFSRKPLLEKHNEVLARIYELDFLMEYIKEDNARSLEVFFFNDKAISKKAIDRFNKNPEEWEKFDAGYTPPKFRHLYCGCNFRLDNEYLQASVLFELHEGDGGSSIWLLLPDGTPVLHFYGGRNVYKFSDDEISASAQDDKYPCLKFDEDGNIQDR